VTEIRPLRLHDLPFVYRLAGQGVNFDTQLGLTVGDDALRHAVLASLGRIQVYVVRRHGASILGQLHYLDTEQHARLAHIAPSIDDGASADLWLALLDGLVVMAGQRGVVTLIAEVGTSAPEFVILRRSGFATYTRQEIWVRPPQPIDSLSSTLNPVETDTGNSLPALISSVVPSLIKHVEPPVTAADRLYTVPERRGPAGMVAVYEGPSADLIEVYVSPQAEALPGQILSAALTTVQAEKRTIYCRVRSYMGCPASALSGACFDLLTTQAAMYRQTAARVQHRTYDVGEKVEAGIALPTSIVDAPWSRQGGPATL